MSRETLALMSRENQCRQGDLRRSPTSPTDLRRRAHAIRGARRRAQARLEREGMGQETPARR